MKLAEITLYTCFNGTELDALEPFLTRQLSRQPLGGFGQPLSRGKLLATRAQPPRCRSTRRGEAIAPGAAVFQKWACGSAATQRRTGGTGPKA